MPDVDAEDARAEAERMGLAIRREFQAEILPIVERHERRSPYAVLEGLVEMLGDRFVKARAADPKRAQAWTATMLAAFERFVAPPPRRPQ
jgi:hypothetical protein